MSIRLVDTTTIRLKVFNSQEAPKYAILSHTWTSDEEVSYQEANRITSDPDHPAAARLGYRKILDTCRKAKSHGYSYVWIDTCCIDKTSSAELSEAINSMFRWYTEAAVCYVYLADLPESSSWRESFGNCRWFTRGWCLQELLAPSGDNLRFYDKSWKFVGTKAELKLDIARITGIGEDVLAGTRLLRMIPIARRMSWAAKRNTTRAEDKAYCLLGIFDVNMPMLYGEGERSFMRLQEEIILRSNDLSIFCAKDNDIPRSNSRQEGRGILDGSGLENTEIPYRNLFARSPRDFASSRDIEFFRNEAMSRNSFELTNNGLHFKETELLVHEQNECYSMPLNCVHSSGPAMAIESDRLEISMFLWKIGPRAFVRLHSAPDTNSFLGRYGILAELEEAYTSMEEAYIILAITPELKPQLNRSRKHAIKFVSKNHQTLRDALQDPVPRIQWDAPTLKFLTFGDDSFEGYLKVFPDMIGDYVLNEQSHQQYFYISCGFEMGSPRRVWVRLFSQRSWQNHEKTQGRMVGLKYLDIPAFDILNMDFTRDKLQLDGNFIRTTVERSNENGEEMFEIGIFFEPSDEQRPETRISMSMPGRNRSVEERPRRSINRDL